MDGFGVGMLATALRALKSRFGTEPQLNLWIRTAPKGAEPFHWHIDIAPRLSIRASYEIATGVDINIFPPERAAGELREALGDS
jgi:UDPglucose--hexose-1-phosphate uridylyltransferase